MTEQLQELNRFRDKSIHIIGASGIEGYTVARMLLDHGFEDLVLHDTADDEQEFRRSFLKLHLYMERKQRKQAVDTLLESKVSLKLGADYLQDIENADTIFASQNWFAHDANNPLEQIKQKHPDRLSSMTELYFLLAPCKILGVTGTNGKSTTVDLIYRMIVADNRKVWYGGNERTKEQALLHIDQIRPDHLLVLEISNRQLMQDLPASPNIAVITNVTPNHITDHGSFEQYALTKKRILEYQQPGDVAIFNYDDPMSGNWDRAARWDSDQFSLKKRLKTGVFVQEGYIIYENKGTWPICKIEELPDQSEPFIYNLLAACAACVHLGLSFDAMRTVALDHEPLPGRMELVGEANGVSYYYDIKSTVPQASLAAVKSLDVPVILIMGGDDKGADFSVFSELSDSIKQIVLLPGSGSDKMKEHIPDSISIEEVDDFEQAWSLIMNKQKSGDAVLLSPGCEGFYSAFLAGKVGFKKRVTSLPGAVPTQTDL